MDRSADARKRAWTPRRAEQHVRARSALRSPTASTLTDAASSAATRSSETSSLLGDLRASRARSERTGLGVPCGPAPESRRFERSKTPSAA